MHSHHALSVAEVVVARANAYNRSLIESDVQHLFESVDGIGDIMGAGRIVAIKVNLAGGSGSATSPRLSGLPVTESMWIHPEVLRAASELIIDCGVQPSDISFVEALWDGRAQFKN